MRLHELPRVFGDDGLFHGLLLGDAARTAFCVPGIGGAVSA